MKANSVGELLTEALIYDQQITGTTPFNILGPTMYNLDSIAFQALTSAYQRTITVDPADHVVASSHTWTFANGAFTAADVGATLTVAGATNSNNNATVTIASVTNATTIVTGGTQTNETFSNGTTTAVLNGGVVMSYTYSAIAVSNNYVSAKLPGLNQLPYAGDWADVTAKFANTGSPFFPALAAVTTLSTNWYQMNPFTGRVVRWTITPSAGQARFRFWIAGKGNR